MYYDALRNELVSDPRGLGYAGKSDAEVAELIHEIGAGGEAIDRKLVAAHEIIEATVPSEWAALSPVAKQHYQTIISAGEVDLKNSNVRAALAGMFGAETVTQSNLGKLGTRPASRADVLGLGRVHYWDVARARAI